jgi:hypothetical protein
MSGEAFILGIIALLAMISAIISGICTLVLAMVLPRTERGKAFSMLIAFGLFYLNYSLWHLVGTSPAPSDSLQSGFVAFNFILLCITIPFVVAIGKNRDQVSRVFLPTVAGVFVFFIWIHNVELRQRWLYNQPQAIAERKAEQEAVYAQKLAWEKEQKEQNRQRDIEMERQALEMMQEVCKKSVETIHRKTENVDGVLVLNKAYYYFFYYGQRAYRYFDNLAFYSGRWSRLEIGALWKKIGELDCSPYELKMSRSPYFLEKDTNYQRYIDDFIKIIALNHATPRYAVDGHDFSAEEEYKNGIRNLSLKVIDLQTKEVMAELFSYRYDGTHHKEVDWGETPRKCPSLDEMEFVKKVLQPAPRLAQ